MASPAADIAGLLVTAGIGTAGTDLFVGREPGTTSLSVTLIDSGGASPNPKYNRDSLDMQVIITGAVDGYDAAYTKAKTIKDYLLGIPSQTIGTNIYFAFNMRSDITFVGYNTNNQPQFTINFRILRDGGDVGNRISL